MGKLTTENPGDTARKSMFAGHSKAGVRSSPIVPEITDLFPKTGNDSLPADTPLPAAPVSNNVLTAKPKARQHSARSREQRRVEKDRHANFKAAVCFAYEMDWPLNVAITINWTCLYQAGSHNEGNCLGRDETGREAYLRAELSRLRLRPAPDTPFVAIWGRDIGKTMGLHTHMALFWPRWDLRSLIRLLERISGSQVAPYEETSGKDVLAESECKGWQIKRIFGKTDLLGALEWVAYIAEQSEKHNELPNISGKAFGVSQAIGPKARAAWQKARAGSR